MPHNDTVIVARIIEIWPSYRCRTDVGDDFSLIDFCQEILQEEFPGINVDQFSRCYIRAFEQTGKWTRTTVLQ